MSRLVAPTPSKKGDFFMKKSKVLLLGLALMLLPINPAVVLADLPSGVSYLQSATQDAWTTQALAAANQTNLSLAHLQSVSGSLATDYAKAILALASAGEDPKTFGNIDYVAKLKTYYNNNQFGDAGLINDDIWSLLALAAVRDTAGQDFIDAKNYILNHQNSDGGWSYAASGSSDSNDTAAAIIALVEAGYDSSSQEVAAGIDYLRTTQNSDGGFGYDTSSDSDSGSDSWVIAALNKLNIQANTWEKDGNDPIEHLNSLQDTDGGFWWVKPGTSDFNNKAMTAYAVIALSGKSFPVGYYQLAVSNDFYLRVEGSAGQICETEVAGQTALDLIKNAAEECNYTYTITQESFGPYLRAINSEEAQGLDGWLYFVNDSSPAVGAADYVLAAGDKVLFYYGQWGWNPTKLILSAQDIEVGQSVQVQAKYFNGTNWLPLPEATIYVNNTSRQADSAGGLTLTFEQNGINQIWLDTPEFVRSAKYKIQVGAGVSQAVGLQAEIDQAGSILGDSIGLEVVPGNLDFGRLKPGQSLSQTLVLRNVGQSQIEVGANVTGDDLFVNQIKINSISPNQFLETIDYADQKEVVIGFAVPASYGGSGVKTGQIIFWATSAN